MGTGPGVAGEARVGSHDASTGTDTALPAGAGAGAGERVTVDVGTAPASSVACVCVPCFDASVASRTTPIAVIQLARAWSGEATPPNSGSVSPVKQSRPQTQPRGGVPPNPGPYSDVEVGRLQTFGQQAAATAQRLSRAATRHAAKKEAKHALRLAKAEYTKAQEQVAELTVVRQAREEELKLLMDRHEVRAVCCSGASACGVALAVTTVSVCLCVCVCVCGARRSSSAWMKTSNRCARTWIAAHPTPHGWRPRRSRPPRPYGVGVGCIPA